jgi:selT/selW/selH-like putative selenoprotein
VSLAQRILNELKQKLEELSLAPYGDGRFEVFVGKKKIYSKLDTMEFPDEGNILKEIAKAAK